LGSLVDLEILVREVFAVSVELLDVGLLSFDVLFGLAEHALISSYVALYFTSLAEDSLEFFLLRVNGTHDLILA
jgi:hypothetical protein